MSKSTDTPNDEPKKEATKASKSHKSAKNKSLKSKSKRTLVESASTKAEHELEEESGGNTGTEDHFSEEEPMAQEFEPNDDDNLLEEDDTSPPIRDIFEIESDEELLNRIAGVYQIWWNWAHFELSIVSPYVAPLDPCAMIYPEELSNGDLEFVYPICDYGNRLATSKGAEMYSVGMSMCKLYYTIEKMIFILIERLKSDGVSTDTEIQISFDGHQLAQRKAFESVINLSYNVVVTNFDPGAWGERYLETVKRLAENGYGYPPEAPRDSYRNITRTSVGARRR